MAKKNKLKKSGKRKAEQRMYEAVRAVMAEGGNAGNGLLGGLNNLLPSRKSERFLLGLLIGAGAAYVLNDEKLRGNIIKSAMKVYAGLAGGVEEIKEQVADCRAELEAEQQDDA